MSVSRERRSSRRLSASRSLPYPPMSPPPPAPPDDRVFLVDQDAEGACAASCKRGQRQFGEMMGMLSDSTSVPDDYHAITQDEASLLADAASHMFVPPFISSVCDGYFTDDEYRRVASDLVGGAPVTMCSCSAHRFLQDATVSRQDKEDIIVLIRSQKPLTDDGGKQFGTAIIRLILHFASVEGTLQRTLAGSEWTISYCLIQGGVITQYKGYPDFILRKNTGEGATIVLTGVGEAQSDQNDVTLQGGIYTVGQLRKRECGRKVCCIALLKNKSMNILVAELKDPTPTGSSLLSNVLGEVTYKYVVGISPLDLSVAEDVDVLASRLVATITSI